LGAVTSSTGSDALLEAGQAAERNGNRVEAREHYERALELLTLPSAGPRAATVMRWIARTFVNDANADAALDMAEAALEVSEACGDHAGAGYAINMKAAVHSQQGNLDDAEQLFLRARSFALTAADAGLGAMTSQNLGVIASIRGDLPEALRHYDNALEHSRALGLVKEICSALNNLGVTHTQLRHWDEAERAYREALEISASTGDLPAEIGVNVNLAEMWLARADFRRADEVVRHALERAAHTEDTAWLPQISKLRGILARNAGSAEEADVQFARAIELAEARHDFLLLAETLRERAELDRDQGRNREALQNLNRAHRLFSELRARRELANVDQSMAMLESDFLLVVRRWGESIEAKDQYTQGHCVRVADLACELAARAGINAQELFWFRIGALLHDVGKLIVPSEVLNKITPLTNEEWELMRRHPSAGVEMLAEIDFPWDIRPIIESHHERWDGKGYPHGLAGDAIPVSARILALADVYDALTSVRSYKRMLTHAEAMELMRKDVGRVFDPNLFVLFEQIAGGDRFRRGGSLHVPAPSPVDVPPTTEPVNCTDDVTGLLARRPLLTTLDLVAAAGRAARRSTAVLVVDIDDFGHVNRTFGHRLGDDVLRMVARELRRHGRVTDVLGRIGDDEFVMLLPETSLDDAKVIADLLREGVAAGRCPSARSDSAVVGVTVSVGVAASCLGELGGGSDDLLSIAGDALSRAKRQGGGIVALASSPHIAPLSHSRWNCRAS
jgi:diguanylate cyclase (GGDEF)-like protein/putative nucleotidyltransferase with HDIG domain